ncbi:MAG: exodeoxyribonuclease III [Candidatus Brocadiaceae bacterium]|nr:exodeoxyribonuclease III [Candidatus Brocadiaceae bacterium]
MKVASYNVNSVRARLPIVIDWLQKESPDIFCIQETKVIDTDFPHAAFEEINYCSVFRGEKSYNGVAIISKFPLKDVRIGFDDSESEGARIITARLNKIRIVNTYIPQGVHPLLRQFREKLAWIERLYDYFKQYYQPENPILWLGDFNIAPESKDVYDPEKLFGSIGFHPDEHAALQRFKEWGFIDVFRLHQPGPEQYTFWDYRVKNAIDRKIGWRVDHIWATRPLAKKSVRAWIDIAPRLAEKPSDHTIIIAEFEV